MTTAPKKRSLDEPEDRAIKRPRQQSTSLQPEASSIPLNHHNNQLQNQHNRRPQQQQQPLDQVSYNNHSLLQLYHERCLRLGHIPDTAPGFDQTHSHYNQHLIDTSTVSLEEEFSHLDTRDDGYQSMNALLKQVHEARKRQFGGG